MIGRSRVLVVGIGAACVLWGCNSSGGSLEPRGDVTLSAPRQPASAPARTAVITTVRGPSAPGTTVTAGASCPSGTTVSGGGVSTLLIGGGMPPSSLHANGTTPSAASATTPAASGSTPAGWAALGATGGQIVFGGATTSVAMCLERPATAKPVTVVVAAVPGPEKAATTARATASCPATAMLLGGGGLTTVTKGSPSPSLHLIGSYPSDARGTAARDGSAGVSSWSALADAGGRTGSGVQTTAFALCAPGSAGRTRIVSVSRPGPLKATTATTATAACAPPATLVSGGAKTGPERGDPQQGLHLTGSFPSNPAGQPPWSSPASAAATSAWSARAESGGQGSPEGTLTRAFAVCLQP